MQVSRKKPSEYAKGPVLLFTQGLADLRLDGLLTLIVMFYGRLGDWFLLLRYPEQLQGPKRDFDAQMETASYQKMKDRMTYSFCTSYSRIEV